MGLNFICSTSSRDLSNDQKRFLQSEWDKPDNSDLRQWKPDPRPKNYKILKAVHFEPYILVRVKYKDCFNYEGEKIMVYKSTLQDLLAQKELDPHFCDNPKYISPIARFEPTNEGWNNAVGFINNVLNRFL